MPLDQVTNLFSAGEPRARGVVLTFDDAWADNHTNALGPLSHHRLPAVLYVPSRLLGRPGYMTRTQLLEVAAAGVAIGAHSRTHADLRACTADDLEREVRGSKEDLEHLLGKPVTSFAYPTGLHNDAVVNAVTAAGFTSAVTARPGWWRQATGLFRIPRGFAEDFSEATFLAAIRGGLGVLGPLGTIKRLAAAQGRQIVKVAFLLTQDRGGPVDLTIGLARDSPAVRLVLRWLWSGRPRWLRLDCRGASCGRSKSLPRSTCPATLRSRSASTNWLRTSFTLRTAERAWSRP